MGKKYVVAYDLGTSGVKVALVDTEGNLLGYATENYSLYTPKTNWAEQDPEWYWEGVCKATKAALKLCGMDPSDAIGMSLCTQWKGIIPIDAEGRVLHNSIIWLDARAGDQADRLNAHFGKTLFCASDYWPKVMWLRENCPEAYENAVIILEANSYVKWKATGEAAVDISNNYIRSFDPDLQALYDDFLAFCDMDREKFPRLCRSSDLVGEITVSAAEELGLVPGIPVFGGCNDIQAISVGAGASAVGALHTYFGSSGWMGLSLPHQIGDWYRSGFDEVRDLSIYGLQSIGLSLNWTIRQLYKKEGDELGGDIYSLVNRDVEAIPAGSEGVFSCPWLYGERPPLFSPEARGTFLNMSARHDRRHMVRAVMEGICYMLKMSGDYLLRQNGMEWPESINAIGGGTRSDVWMQILSDVLNMRVNVPKYTQHAGALGAAYCALIGLGIRKDLQEVAEKIVIERSYEPVPEAVRIYEEGREVFQSLHDLLFPLYSRLSAE